MKQLCEQVKVSNADELRSGMHWFIYCVWQEKEGSQQIKAPAKAVCVAGREKESVLGNRFKSTSKAVCVAGKERRICS